MNTAIVKRLMLKEWYFQRWWIAGYFAAGLVAVAFLAGHSNGAFYAGVILLLTAMIAGGVQLAIAAGVYERTEQTLPFIMTLPISPREYATAKIGANVAMFVAPWGLLSLATLALFWASHDARGLIPFAAILLIELLTSFCLVLGVAIVTESQAWSIGAMMLTNLFLQGFLYYVSHMPEIESGMRGKTVTWGPAGTALIVAEIAISIMVVGMTFVLQSRKKNFI
jgi:ABC-2 type transport system permease protein